MARGRSPWSTGAAATAVMLPLAYSPSVYATFWSPKSAILLVAGAAGLTRLPLLLRSPLRRTVIAALSLLAIATLSTLVSPAPVQALFGVYNWGTGLVFVACLVGVWALGAAAAGGDRLVATWLVVGCAASAAVALVQSAWEVPLPVLEDDGRAIGLAGDGTHLGTIATVGLVLAAWGASTSRWWLLAVLAFGATVQVSGTRSALAVAVVAVVGVALVRAPRRLPELAAVLVLGLAMGGAIGEAGGIETASSRALNDRALAAATGGGLRVRGEVWLSARHAFFDRPVLGAGPGRFRAATSKDRTVAIARAEGSGVLYVDAHNLAVEYTVTTGALGVAALAWWVVSALRRARGQLLAVALVLLALSLIQSQSVGTTPLLFLALGAGSAAALPAAGRVARIGTPAVVLIGAAAGLALVAGDQALLELRQTFDLSNARRADVLLRPWPNPASVIGRAHEFLALGEPEAQRRAEENAEARRWHRRAIDRDPTDPGLYRSLAEEELTAGLVDDAERHLRQALEHDPVDVASMVALAGIASDRGDRDEAVAWFERAQAILPSSTIERRLRELRP